MHVVECETLGGKEYAAEIVGLKKWHAAHVGCLVPLHGEHIFAEEQSFVERNFCVFVPVFVKEELGILEQTSMESVHAPKLFKVPAGGGDSVPGEDGNAGEWRGVVCAHNSHELSKCQKIGRNGGAGGCDFCGSKCFGGGNALVCVVGDKFFKKHV